MVVMGPNLPRRGRESDAQSGYAMIGEGQGTVVTGDAAASISEAERLDPVSAGARSNRSPAMIGVPVHFRDQAEAYFRRLARDSQNKRGNP